MGEDWHTLCCLQEFAFYALGLSRLFCENLSSVTRCTFLKDISRTRTFILQAVTYGISFRFLFHVILARSSKKRATGSHETQRDCKEFAATQKVTELKRNLEERTCSSRTQREGKIVLTHLIISVVFCTATFELFGLFGFFFPQTTCSNFSTTKIWIFSTNLFFKSSVQFEGTYSFRNKFEYFSIQQK